MTRQCVSSTPTTADGWQTSHGLVCLSLLMEPSGGAVVVPHTSDQLTLSSATQTSQTHMDTYSMMRMTLTQQYQTAITSLTVVSVTCLTASF